MQVARHQLHPTADPTISERAFYQSYEWCLNPLLSLRDLFRRLREEIDRYPSLQAGWQREEAVVNLCIFACAIACTVDDYLVWRPWNLSAIGQRLRRLRFLVVPLQWLLNRPHSLRRLASDRGVARWRVEWHECVDHLCDALASPVGPDPRRWARLRDAVRGLAEPRLPERLFRRRMRLPQGFRCQDLTHHDVLALARRFAAVHPDRRDRLAVVGLRTAGAYAAPLVAAALRALGWPSVSWITIRPKLGLSRWERRGLRRLLPGAERVLVVDEQPETGHSLRLGLARLAPFLVPPERIAILAPSHTIRPDWDGLRQAAPGATLVTLEASELHKEQRLDPRSLEPLLREYLGDLGRAEVRIEESPAVDAINARLWEHYSDGFHAPRKRVLEVTISRSGHAPVARRIIAKSVGWGWLGYHAYLAGTRLDAFVPRVIGLRHGLLFSEWIEDVGRRPEGLVRRYDPLKTVAAYVAQRVRRLGLQEDPSYATPGQRWTGRDEIIQMLRGVYGPYLGRLKAAALRRHLRRSACPLPTLIDGRMRTEDWVLATGRMYKVDFEHHNFGAASLDLVDPAYDLASSVLEWRLSEQAEGDLLRAYVRDSGDHGVFDRILLYKLLHGGLTVKNAVHSIARSSSREEQETWNERFIAARTFLTEQMSRFGAGQLARRARPQWSRRLFFLDLDGVLDHEHLGFPHTTVSGLAALDLLQAHGFSVVLNTGRSVEHVRIYCRTYGLPGGIAEHGSVLVDAAGERELELADAEGLEQIHRCREAIRKVPGVFLDPEFRYSVRAYRYCGQGTAGLPRAEIESVLAEAGCRRLTSICRGDATYIVQDGIDKGSALRATKRYLGLEGEPVSAMGDSDQDVAMLRAAEFSYAPANCSTGVRELVRADACRLMKQRLQKGLLAAARDLVRRHPAVRGRHPRTTSPVRKPGDPMTALLQVAERSRLRQYMAVLRWRSL